MTSKVALLTGGLNRRTRHAVRAERLMQRQSQNVNLIEDRLREEQVRFVCQSAARASPATSMARVVELLREDCGGCVVVTDAPGDASHGDAFADASVNGRPVGIFSDGGPERDSEGFLVLLF